MRKLSTFILVASLCLLGKVEAQFADPHLHESTANIATPYYFQWDTNLTTSVAFTNDFDYPWRVGGLSYAINGGNTNVFTLAIVKRYPVYTRPTPLVFTNDIGRIETNNYGRPITGTSYTSRTNTLIIHNRTNVASVVLEGDAQQLKGFYIDKADIVRITCTDGQRVHLGLVGLR